MAARPESVTPQASAEPLHLGKGRLRQFMAYARKVFGLDLLLSGIRDRRKEPKVPTSLVTRIVFLLGLLRIRSFNALEPKLNEPFMKHALGKHAEVAKRICSVDTLAYSLSRMDVPTVRDATKNLIEKAERNKVFREGWHGAMRFVALDGWEPISSYNRHCPACLTREVRVKRDGVEVKETQYYHAFAVAMLIDDRLDVVLDMEPIRSADVRAEAGEPGVTGHEGELTAAKRLVRRLRATYGRWLDVLVVDALYGNGPFLTIAKQYGFGVVTVLKKENNEPLKEALSLWQGKPADKVVDCERKHERIELWDCPGIETLESYDGPIRVVRGVVHDLQNETVHTWCLGVAGCTTRLSAQKVLQVGRGRWHIENTAFHQFTNCWRFDHVFTHGADAIPALFFIFILAFNLLQLFLYRQLCCYGRDRGKDVTRTISRLVDEMLDNLAQLDSAIAWNSS